MLKVTNMLTDFNHDKAENRKIKFIVIHWVGAVSSALNNGRYFMGGDRGASAHYFVDDTNIVKSVREKNIAWAVGSSGLLDQGSAYAKCGHKYFGKCTNGNSISIEMCCKKNTRGHLYISAETIRNTADLVKELMERYNIVAENIIRHFDVNGKLCPLPYVEDWKWRELRFRLTGQRFRAMAKMDLNVRNQAKLTSSKNGIIPKGKTITIIDVNKSWGKVNGKGWISIKDKYVQRAKEK